ARRSRTHGRRRLTSPARVKKLRGRSGWGSPSPYGVIGGVGAHLAPLVSAACSRTGEVAVHGRIFGAGAPRLSGDAALATGALPASAAVRDFWPEQYAINLARGAEAAGEGVGYCLAPEDFERVAGFLPADPGARVLWFRGAWAIDLFAEAPDPKAAGALARERSAEEREALAALAGGGAALSVRSAAVLIDEPAAAAAEILAAAGAARAPGATPRLAPNGWEDAAPFLEALRQAGAPVEPALLAAAGRP
ncbi:MAG: hypothetical protein AAF322_10435, partial [Pseudomonadota bacterium]